MLRLFFTMLACVSLLAACGGSTKDTGAPRISDADSAEIQFRHLDAVNNLRAARGLPSLQLSPELSAAGKTHAFDISRQNRPWHFGSDGSSPIDRVIRAGYPGQFLGENLSETYEDDIQSLSAWMGDALSRQTILDPEARYLGLGWHQEQSGKIWWVQVTGA